jgi:hypothetical protein
LYNRLSCNLSGTFPCRVFTVNFWFHSASSFFLLDEAWGEKCINLLLVEVKIIITCN